MLRFGPRNENILISFDVTPWFTSSLLFHEYHVSVNIVVHARTMYMKVLLLLLSQDSTALIRENGPAKNLEILHVSYIYVTVSR